MSTQIVNKLHENDQSSEDRLFVARIREIYRYID